MSGWSLVDADAEDVQALARIMGDWVCETDWMPVLHTRDDDVEFVAGLLKTHIVRVARNGPDRLGFLARRGGGIQALHVAAGSRGHGIGRALLEEVKSQEAEVDLWTFQANSRAIAFYLREGFRAVEQTDGSGNDEGLADVRLAWRAAQ